MVVPPTDDLRRCSLTLELTAARLLRMPAPRACLPPLTCAAGRAGCWARLWESHARPAAATGTLHDIVRPGLLADILGKQTCGDKHKHMSTTQWAVHAAAGRMGGSGPACAR